MSTIDPAFIRRVTFSNLEDGDIVEVLRNRWWITIDDQPIMYRNNVQCNGNLAIAETIQKVYPGSKLKFIELALVPCDLSH